MASVRPAWSLERLERACRKELLSRARLKLTELPMGKVADVTWTGEGVRKIRMDHHNDGLRPATLHELLHSVLDDSLVGFDELCSEEIVRGLERLLDQRICKSMRRLEWWRKNIEARLK